MIPPSQDDDEPQRLAALHGLRILDTPPEERFDRITRMARDVFQVPIALISLIDADRQWLKSNIGMDVSETSRAVSFCGHAILGDGPLVVENALDDPRFADNPLVTGAPDIRFYAGMPLRSRAGKKVGTLCLIGRAPQPFPAEQQRRLRDLAAWVELELNRSLDVEDAIVEMRETFVRLVSHELRTPVTGIVGALELINNGMAVGENLDLLTRVATDGAGRLNRVVESIVEIAQLDAAPQNLPTNTIDLGLFLEAAMDSVIAVASQRGATIRLDVADELFVAAHQQSLVRILRSLLDNAISFSPPESTIVIAAGRSAPDTVRISVEDCGPGIPAEYIPKLFLPFSQADASDSRNRDGCGVSLAISRRMAIAMGSRLGYAASETGGSCFYLDLPG